MPRKTVLLTAFVLLALMFTGGSLAATTRVHCVVPNVRGLTLRAAATKIRHAHCSVGRVRSHASTLKFKGRVLAQSPRPGRRLAANARVSLVVGTGPSTPGTTPLRFDLSGATGLALESATTATTQRTLAAVSARPEPTRPRMLAATQDTPLSNLYAVDSSGQLTQAVTSGSATISKFLIAPNGDVYTLFAQPTDLSTTPDVHAYCLLAQVDRATGVPTCVDSTLSQIAWPAPNTGANPAIQFDASGRIYYAGYTSTGTLVLRRFASGTSTNLISDNVQLWDFLVLPDGTVFLTGQTASTGALWLRRLAPDGSLHSLSSQRSYFMKLFPDGNVYLGMWGGNAWGVQRFLTGTSSLEAKLWIGDPINNLDPDVYFHTSDLCPQAGDGFCGYYGTQLTDTFTTSTGSVFGLTGPAGFPGRLLEYYPAVRLASSTVEQAHVAAPVGDKIALAGLNGSGQNVLTLYDPSADAESQLIGPDHEIEIYHAEYVPSSNSLLFDGLRFSDNTYIVGDVDLATGSVTVGTTINGELADLQTF